MVQQPFRKAAERERVENGQGGELSYSLKRLLQLKTHGEKRCDELFGGSRQMMPKMQEPELKHKGGEK